MASQRRTKLKDLIGKVWIEAQAKDLPGLYEELKEGRIRGVLAGKKNDYLNSLIGFVCRPNKKAGERWEIPHEEFEAKLSDLNSTYCKETRRFPRKHFGVAALEDKGSDRDDLFVKKIQEIKYHEVICKAISDFEATLRTINQEFLQYAVDPVTIQGYTEEVIHRFMAGYRTACRNCCNVLTDSKNLYDSTTGSPATPLPGFDNTPDEFRNGLIHERMNDPSKDLKWMVSKDD